MAINLRNGVRPSGSTLAAPTFKLSAASLSLLPVRPGAMRASAREEHRVGYRYRSSVHIGNNIGFIHMYRCACGRSCGSVQLGSDAT
jgi:hypothetical protein